MKLRTRKLPLLNVGAIVASILVIVTAAAPAPAQDSASGASIFKEKCITCHGADGTGTAVGKSLGVANLRSAEIQKKSDAELTQSISDGKNNMPGFKGNITDDEIHAVLGYVRTLAPKGGEAPSKKK